MLIPISLQPYRALFGDLERLCPSLTFAEPMSVHTTFRAGGRAAATVTPEDQRELVQILSLIRQKAPTMPIAIIGKGSNVLFDDDGFCGLVIFTAKLQNVDFSSPDEDGSVMVYAECGASLTVLSRQCATEGRTLTGLEFAFGIPGTVGGAVVMNAGAYDGEMSDITVAAEYFDPYDGEIKVAEQEALHFSYRHSLFSEHPEYIVLSATLRMKPGDGNEIVNRMAANMTSRRLKQPLELPNAGSIFKRPADGHFAGKLIEDSGLKGFRIGGAQVSEKHAGFIVNTDNATASDIMALIEHIKHVVKVNFGIALERESKYISNHHRGGY